MIGLKQAVALLASAIVFVSSLFVPAGDQGTVAVQSLDGSGTEAVAQSPVSIELDGLKLYDLTTSEASVIAPAKLDGTVARVSGIASATGPPGVLRFGGEHLEIPPGSRVTVEHITGTVTLEEAPLSTEVAIEGTATNVRIVPPEDPSVSTASGVRGTIPARDLSIDGRPVEPGFRDTGAFGSLSFTVPSEALQGSTPQLFVGGEAEPIREEVSVTIEDYVGLTALVEADEGTVRIELQGFGKVKIGDETVQRNVSKEVNATLPHPGPVNEDPEANFSFRPRSPQANETVHFVDESEDDLAIRDWHWDFGDGSTSTAQHPEHAFPAAGVYDVTLTVTDVEGKQDQRTRTVTVVNSRPHVEVSWRPLTPLEIQRVHFTATVEDRDGDVTSVRWSFSDGRSFEGLNVSRTFPDEGSYNLTVTATDSEGAQGSVDATIHVVNAPPIANFTVDPKEPMAGEPVTLTSTSRDRGDGSIVNHTWTIPGLGERYGSEVTVRIPQDGRVPIRLTVTDDGGKATSEERTVHVLNPPPSVSIDASPVYPNPGEVVQFTARIDDDDPPEAVQWTFSDGATRTGVSVERTFPSGGPVDVQVLVEDEDGATGTANRTIQVNHEPRLTLFVPDEGTGIDETAVLTGTTLDVQANTSDPDGNTTETSWRLDGDPVASDAVTACTSEPTADGSRVACSWPDDGRHVLRATATDENGASRTQRLDVLVLNREPTLSPTFNVSVINVDEPVQLQSNAADQDGSIEEVRWFQEGEKIGEGRRLNHTFTSGGPKNLTVDALDDDGARSSVAFQVHVNIPPEIDASFAPENPTAGDTVSFDAEAVDPDGPESGLSYRWDFGDGATANEPDPDHVYAEGGSYEATLVVEDEDGGLAEQSLTVEVTTPPLNAEILADPSTPRAGTVVNLTVGFDGQRSVREVVWSFGDGASETTQGPSVTHLYEEPVTVRVEAQVETDDGAQDTAALDLRVVGDQPHTFELSPHLPDGQCVNLAAPNVDVRVRNLQTQATLALHDGDHTFSRIGPCTLTGAFPAGAWSVGDGVRIRGIVGSGTTTETRSFSVTAEYIDPDFTLLEVPIRIENLTISDRERDPLVLNGSDRSSTYHDPTEPVHVIGRLIWGEGTPAQGYNADLGATYSGPRDLLGGQAVEYRGWDTETGQDGWFSSLVPAPAAGTRAEEQDDPGSTSFVYLPGRYEVRARTSSGLLTATDTVTFVEDPQGIFHALEEAGATP